ncbi:MAG TPA: TnsA endonuclease N-terminal domain-containing protein [Cyclobacteriaceae bacterium]|nr:Tn7 transposase TnsA N-terminal domain-containing protein [Cyclobacteriaceae bacterium]MBX7089429.1 TnsA endonuclease N-terminal domain-containing protein [Cyclobacteriaceae bacterium]HMV07449.1 TnsA endonuclease N-terminal domain-containing protein [Cyclobacteriaceae bacterium]HMW99196.1 TnsA endonuclease N-terminal domain-containing protein [Cyclobacteriaceae bacterium]HMX48171.1 TnsA endonuclease N-terminal domain-containing protein [Cyclobacteriaceae bacterium]
MAKNRITDKGRKRQRRGYGAGTDNRPWLTVRDFSSSGKSFRVLGDVTNRVHQLLSTLEYKVFSSFDWNPLVTDIREQCSLPLEETTSIALELGIRHPTHKGKPVVMSTDFYVILKNRSVAITVKYSRKLTKRAIQKFEIEKEYWRRKGVSFYIVTEREINPIEYKNLQLFKYCQHITLPSIGEERFKQELRKHHEYPDATLSQFLRILAEELNVRFGDLKQFAQYLAFNRKIIFDLSLHEFDQLKALNYAIH